MHRISDDERIDFFLTASRWDGEVRNMEPQKCDQLAWFPMAELPANVIPYVRRALENYMARTFYDSFGWERS